MPGAQNGMEWDGMGWGEWRGEKLLLLLEETSRARVMDWICHLPNTRRLLRAANTNGIENGGRIERSRMVTQWIRPVGCGGLPEEGGPFFLRD
jgi:hypothetical protein